jgi:LPXTG-site transpeptidase (sortase) family protein
MATWLKRAKKLWGESTTARRAAIVAVPIVVLAITGVGIGFAVSMGRGGGAPAQAVAQQATSTATAADTPTVVPTETPASAGAQATDQQPPNYTPNTAGRAAPSQSGTGPGAAQDTGMSLVIPSISVNASVYSRSVGTNGMMGNPSGAWDVILYDFDSAGWQGLGGYPGQPGANAVFAGHVDYIHVGPAVFWSVRDLQPGDQVTVNTPNGPITYSIQWSQWTDPDVDFTQYVRKTGQESITLVTCVGDFSAGHYSNRLIVRGVRV